MRFMKKFTRRELILVYIAFLFTITFMGYYLLIIPMEDRYSEAKSNLELARADKIQLEAGIRSIDGLKSGNKQKKELFLEAQKVFRPVLNSADAEQEILKYLDICGITPEKTKVGRIEEKRLKDSTIDREAYVYTAAVNIYATGNWGNFKKLLDLTSREERINMIDFTLKRDDSITLTDGKDFSIVMDVEYYMLHTEKSPGQELGKEKQQ